MYNFKKLLIISFLSFSIFSLEVYSQTVEASSHIIKHLLNKGLKVGNLTAKEYAIDNSSDQIQEIIIDKKTTGSVGNIGNEFHIETTKGYIKLKGTLEIKSISPGSLAGIYCTATNSNKDVVVFNNLTDWKFDTGKMHKIDFEIPFDKPISKISWGVYVSGVGFMKVENLTIQVSEREFETKAVNSRLNDINVQSSTTNYLANFGSVMGFLKYYHPSFNRGKVDWDSLFVSKIPEVLMAESKKDYNHVVDEIIRYLGAVPSCDTCFNIRPDSLSINYNVKFVNDDILSNSNRKIIKYILDNYRFTNGYYVSTSSKGTPNPEFKTEKGYKQMVIPNIKYRLLTLFRYWNIINYFYPYKYAIKKDWNKELKILIPYFIKANTLKEFQASVLLMNASINDSHSSSVSGISSFLLPSIVGARLYEKETQIALLPLNIKSIRNENIVINVDSSFSSLTGIKKGDFIQSINGTPMDTILKVYHNYISGSNLAFKNLVISNNNFLSFTNLDHNKLINLEYLNNNVKKQVAIKYNQSDFLPFFKSNISSSSSEKNNLSCLRILPDHILY